MDELFGKHADLTISKPDALYRMAHALASPVRIRIMQELGIHTLSVGELAQALDIPMSTAALSVKILEEAGIIKTETQPGVRGVVKLCSRRLDTLAIALVPEDEQRPSSLTPNRAPVDKAAYASPHIIKSKERRRASQIHVPRRLIDNLLSVTGTV